MIVMSVLFNINYFLLHFYFSMWFEIAKLMNNFIFGLRVSKLIIKNSILKKKRNADRKRQDKLTKAAITVQLCTFEATSIDILDKYSM